MVDERFFQFLQISSRGILKMLSRTNITGMEHVPETGGAVVVTNHIGRLDAMLGVVLTHRSDFIMLIADKYQDSPLWLNREEADFQAMKMVLKRLKQGEILGMAPEGTRSPTEQLQQGRQGAAFLAAKANVPIVPVGMTGTEDRVVKDRFSKFQRLDINIQIGAPFYLPPIDRKDKDAYFDRSTDEIMCRIAAQLPPSHWGVYADHPRLHELLADETAAQINGSAEALS